jgi:hypothetical protein
MPRLWKIVPVAQHGDGVDLAESFAGLASIRLGLPSIYFAFVPFPILSSVCFLQIPEGRIHQS